MSPQTGRPPKTPWSGFSSSTKTWTQTSFRNPSSQRSPMCVYQAVRPLLLGCFIINGASFSPMQHAPTLLRAQVPFEDEQTTIETSSVASSEPAGGQSPPSSNSEPHNAKSAPTPAVDQDAQQSDPTALQPAQQLDNKATPPSAPPSVPTDNTTEYVHPTRTIHRTHTHKPSLFYPARPSCVLGCRVPCSQPSAMGKTRPTHTLSWTHR